MKIEHVGQEVRCPHCEYRVIVPHSEDTELREPSTEAADLKAESPAISNPTAVDHTDDKVGLSGVTPNEEEAWLVDDEEQLWKLLTLRVTNTVRSVGRFLMVG